MDNVLLLGTSEADGWLHSIRHVSLEEMLLPVLLQLIVIILVSRLFALLFRRVGQPSVVGEIAAGLILGPSVLGRIFPELSDVIFHPRIAELPPELSDRLLFWIFAILSQLGLILLLFLIGLEFDFGHLRRHGKAALGISLAGIVLPFALGMGLTPLLLSSEQLGTHPDRLGPLSPLGLGLFMGTALSITALPILGRMMMELGITRTRIGAITITAAAADDVTGWILLATVAAVVKAQFESISVLRMVAETVGFALFMIFVARPLMRWWLRRTLDKNHGNLPLDNLAVLLAIILVCAIATNLIGIFAIFGPFFLGAILSGEQEFRAVISNRLRDLVTAFFLPIFFTYTVLRPEEFLYDREWRSPVIALIGFCHLGDHLPKSRDQRAIKFKLNSRE